MAGTLNDVIMQATGGPTVNDGLLAYYRAGGATATTLPDAERQWLLTQLGKPASAPDTNADLWRQLTAALPGAINDQLYAYWASAPSSNPAVQSLFAAGEQGCWYDASDFNAMWQDSVGTIPVTAVEQPVGLILDKKTGAARGSELRAGFVPSLTGVPPAPATYNAATGAATVARTDASNQSFVTLTGLNINTLYEVTLQNTGAISISLRTNGAATVLGPVTPAGQTLTYHVYPSGGGANFAVVCVTDGQTASFTVASVKQILGNHIVQPTAASRLVISARKNLLFDSNNTFSPTTAWLDDGGTAVDNGTNIVADGQTFRNVSSVSNGATFNRVSQNTNWVNGAPMALTVYSMAGTSGRIRVTIRNVTAATETNFFGPIASPSVGTPLAGTITIVEHVDIGGGVWRSKLIFTPNSTPAANGGSLGVGPDSGVVGQNVVFLGAQFEIGSTVTRFQRIGGTLADYDSAGYPMYWTFDGVDDGMFTPVNVSFATTDKVTIWTGAVKQSDAAYNSIAELGPIPDTTAATFGAGASGTTGDASRRTWASSLRGDTNFVLGGAAIYTSPDIKIMTTQLDIAGAVNSDECKMRLNSVPQTLTFVGAAAGGGNFGSFPLYIGRRNNASNPFNGRLYQLIIRGAASTAGQITSTENYIAGKMQITIP